MSGNGLLYAAIVGAWAAYLIPLWLRRQDDSAAGADRVSAAMRVLSRRTPPLPQQRYLLRPRSAPPLPVVKRSGHTRPAVPTVTTAPQSRSVDTLSRRRQVLIVLGIALLTAVIGGDLGVVPWPVAVAVSALLVAYVIKLRTLARRALAAARSRRAHADRPVRVGRAAAPAERAQRRISVPAQQVAPGVRNPADDSTRSPADGWDPVPVPLPTYVTAPKAVRAVRTIQLPGEGAWTSARLRDEEAAARRPVAVPDPAPVAAHETAASDSVQQPRAVND
jgi:hypothetical protein